MQDFLCIIITKTYKFYGHKRKHILGLVLNAYINSTVLIYMIYIQRLARNVCRSTETWWPLGKKTDSHWEGSEFCLQSMWRFFWRYEDNTFGKGGIAGPDSHGSESVLSCRSILVTVTFMIILSFGGINNRICPRGAPISEMDSIALPTWEEPRKVNADHICNH
jgi:hypothetical protein